MNALLFVAFCDNLWPGKLSVTAGPPRCFRLAHHKESSPQERTMIPRKESALVRQRSHVVEGLEQRVLLAGLSFSLTTDQSVYQLGQPIEMSIIATNPTDQPVTVPRAQPAGFSITHDGALDLIDFLPQIIVTGT
jgi:hypothetical protein